MNDTTTLPTITFPTVATTDERPVMIGELARAHAAEKAAQERITALEVQLHAARTEQITDGADPRLLDFWDRAGRIADHADFCDEYDRMAEAMNGAPRERDWEVTTEATITITISRVVNARNAEEAEEELTGNVDDEALIEAIRYNHWDIEFSETEANRA